MVDIVNNVGSSRDVIILELKLIGSNGKTRDLDKERLFNAINIFEDIFQPVITGTINIRDGVGMFMDLAIHGNEYLYITFGRPGETSREKRYTKTFRVFKVTDRQKSPNSQDQTYVLHFCSEEMIFSNQQTISKALSGANASDYIFNICVFDLKTRVSKIADFENSFGCNEFVLTNQKPLDAINYLVSQSFSQSLSPFLFFENKDGFNLLSLETLYNRDIVAAVKYNTAKFTAELDEGPFLNSIDVNTFKFNKCFDVNKNVKNGSYSCKLHTLDLITQKYTKHSVSLLNQLNAGVMIDGYFPFNNATNRNNKALYQEYDSNIKYWLTNKDRTNSEYFVSKRVRSRDSHVEETLAQRMMQIDLINNTEIHCIVPGNPQYSAGYTIDFTLPAFTSNFQNERVTDPYYSGKYLITAVRHVITPGSLQTEMELSKNSVSAPLDLSAENQQYKLAQKQ